MKKVAVLMSTYNGELYIREQIDSILMQEGIIVDLFIRDDGSGDTTLEILSSYSKRVDNIFVIKGRNLGVGNSFLELLYYVPKAYDYYAFSDQDDVWMHNKIHEATKKIMMEDIPTLYVSNQVLVDSKLNKIGMRFKEIPSLSYKQILCQNKLSGCTMVWNNALHRLLSDNKRRPSTELMQIRIHDVWVAMVASVVGEIVFDTEGYIMYRQHDKNVVGIRRTNIIKQWVLKLKDPSKRNGRSLLCKEIYDKFCDCITDQTCISDVECYGNYKSSVLKKLKLMKDSSIRQYTGENIVSYEFKVLMNLF